MKGFFNRSSQRELKQLFRENAAHGKPLCVMDDLVFKAMLAADSNESREALRHLLSACTRRQVASVRVLNNELIPSHLKAKSVRLDVNASFNDGEVADLEMQMNKSDDDLKTRAAIYAAMLLSSQTKRGEPYRKTKRVYQIFFLNCILFPESEKLPRRYSYREEQEHDRLTEAVEIIFYELPKMETRVRQYFEGKISNITLSEDEKWCIYMKYRAEEGAEPLIEELCRKEEGLMWAERALSKVDRDYAKYMRHMNILKNSMDQASREYNAREEGRNDEKLEIARKMKKAGRPLNEIIEFTGLSSETIEGL